MSEKIDTSNLICDFGRFKGEPWTRLPVSYLKWLGNEGGRYAPTALAEMKRRGIPLTQEVDVTGHAVDRASQKMIGKWMETRVGDEGIHSWLARMATAARARGREFDGRYEYAGMLFTFAEGQLFPVLTTVMLDRSK